MYQYHWDCGGLKIHCWWARFLSYSHVANSVPHNKQLKKVLIRLCHYRRHPKDGEGNVFSLFTPGGGGGRGYPYPIMLCNITQNSMGQTPRGVPYLGGTLPGGTQVWYPPWPGQDRGEYPAGGYPAEGCTQVGYTLQGIPPGQVRTGGYPVRTTEGVLTTRRAVCLLRSRRRTFLFWNQVDSKIMLGLTGVLLVLVSVSSSLGFLSFCQLPGKINK